MMYTKHSINSLCSEAPALHIGSHPPLTLKGCQRIFRIKCYVLNALNVHIGLLLPHSLSSFLATSRR